MSSDDAEAAPAEAAPPQEAPTPTPPKGTGRAADERLLELVAALGSADPARLKDVLGELRAARGRGERVDVATFLAERGVVPKGVLEDLLGGDEARPRSGLGVIPGDDDSGSDVEEPPRHRRSRKARRVSSDQLPRATRKPAEAPRESVRLTRPPGEEAPPPRAKSARAQPPAPVMPPELRDTDTHQPASASAPAPPGEETTTSVELDTRRFDPVALAAASARRRQGLPPAAVPALAGVALVLVAGGLYGIMRRLASVPEPPQPVSVTDLPPPVTEEPPPPELPVEVAADPTEAPPAEPPPDPWPALAQRARALVDDERYAEARALLEGAPLEVRAARSDEVASVLGRLAELDAFRLAADAALREADELRRAGKGADAARRVQALLDAHPDLASSATGRRVEAARLEALEASTAPAAPAARAREEPPERARAFAAAAGRGREVVQAVRARVQRDRQRLDEVVAAELERVRAASAQRPLDLELAPGYVVRGASIEAMDDRGLSVRPAGSQDLITRTWGSLPPEVALRVRRLALRDDVAEDHVRLGRWCLANRLIDEARQAFARAVALDPKLLGQVPDVSAVQRSSKLFNGALEHSGTSLELTYRFARAAEAADFQDEAGARGVLRDGRLEVRGKGCFVTALPEIGFDGRVSVNARLGPTSRDGLSVVGVAFGFGTRREVAWLAGIVKGSGDLLLFKRQGGKARVVERKPGLVKGGATEVGLEVVDGKLRVRALRRTQLKVDVQPEWEGVRVVVGGVCATDGAGSVERLTVRGAVRAEWLRKSFGEVDARLFALLARTDELPVFVAPAVRPVPPQLSAEDAFGLEGVPAEALEVYREARIKAASGAPLDQLAAANGFERALELAPGFAAASYRRALVLEALGRPHVALTGLEQACAQCPRFYEALAERARVLTRIGREDEALKLAEEALALRPDHAPAWAARGLVAFLKGDLPRALEDLDVALALDPWNDEVRARRRNVVHVLRGPPWARTFRFETDHFTVETDISQKRCEEYARDLQAVRRFYAERFGLDPDAPPADGLRARVLIFDTREGFHAYAELTTDDRVESLLGCYLPRYRQLLLYEDKDDADQEETRRVLFHEAFHQFIDGVGGDLPYWLNEGLAEYFSAARVEQGSVVPPDASSRLEERLDDLRRFVGQGGGPVPFPRLMNESPGEFYSGPVAAKYAQAWAMVHFFQHGGSTELRERFRRYVAALREGMSARRAFHAAWEGVSWPDVQQAWLEHVKRM